MQRGDMYYAYDRLHELDRHLIETLTDDELVTLSASTDEEAAKKLSGWRLRACKRIASLKWRSERSRVIAALREKLKHLHTVSQNLHFNSAQLKRQLVLVAVFLVVPLIAFPVLWSMGALAKLQTDSVTMITGSVAGLLGGIVSLALSVTNADPKSNIPAIRLSFQMAALRPLFGAASALVVVIAALAKIIPILDGKPGDESFKLVFFAFLAGFSERWFLGFLESQQTTTKPP